MSVSIATERRPQQWRANDVTEWPELSRVVRALDGAAVLDLLQRYDGDTPFGSGKIVDAQCQRVHFGGNIGIVVDYTFTLAEPGGRTHLRKGFVQVPRGDARSAWGRIRQKLARAGCTKPLLLLDGLLVRGIGVDDRIDSLDAICSGRPLVDAASTAATILSRPGTSSQLLTHRLGKRAVLRLSDCDAEQPRSIVKLYKQRSDGAAQATATLAALSEAFRRRGLPITVPLVKAQLASINAIVMSEANGRLLCDLEGDARTAGMRMAGRALGMLHGTSVEHARGYQASDDLALLRGWIDFISALEPKICVRLEAAFTSVRRAFADCAPVSHRTIHRDFHERQILTAGSTATLIDFDTISRGDPAQDVGNFVAHLWLSQHLGQRSEEAGADAFREGYAEADGPAHDHPANIAAHRKATLFRLALINWVNPHRRPLVDRLLEEVQRP